MSAPSGFDRFGVAMANLALSLPTGVLLWIVLNGFPWGWTGWVPAWSILAFALVMTALGGLMQQNLLLDIYARSWRFIVDFLRH